MQVQIRNPISVDVELADEKGAVLLHFVTAAEHEAVVTLASDLLPGLMAKLKEFTSRKDESTLRTLLQV